MRGATALIATALIATALIATVLAPSTVLACGACFSPPAPVQQQTILQDSERIYFHRDPATKKTTVHIEIRYTGLAKDFGWVLPLPAQPKVGVGSSYLFDRLDQATAPRFVAKWNRTPLNCRQQQFESSGGGGCGSFDSATAGGGVALSNEADSGSSGDGGVAPPVTVLEQSQAGPYDFVTLASKSADDLYKWLTDRGYDIPATAKDIVQAHLDKGDVFVAFKLANGEGINAIRPVTLEMDDVEPCVPMRLTSIAAVEDMAVTVYLAGPGRAIPKNHMHVLVNPMRLAWTEAGPPTNYVSVLSEAIDEAAGRAFATEAALLPKDLKIVRPATDNDVQTTTMFEEKIDGRQGYGEGALFADKSFDLTGISGVKTARELIAVLAKSSLVIAPEVAATLEKYSKLHANFGPVTQESRTFWQNVTEGVNPIPSTATQTDVDGAALAAELEKEFSGPMREASKQIATSKMFTRLALRISPEEMLRDPIFAFNESLSVIDPVYSVELRLACRDGEFPVDAVQLKSALLDRTWLMNTTTDFGFFPPNNQFNFALDDRFKNAPAARVVELLDETGPARPVAFTQVDLVDSAIAGAEPGKPQLPAGFELKKVGETDRWQMPAADADPTLKTASDDLTGDAGGCSQNTDGSPRGGPLTLLALILVAVAALWGRRYV